MIVLGIETSARWGGAALADESGLLGQFELRHGGRTEHLHSILKRLVAEAGLGQDDIGAVAVSVGPGSFTGLRIGLCAAKGFCLASDCPIVAVPLVPLLVARAAPWSGAVAAWIDAGRGEVYGALFEPDAAATVSRTLPLSDHLASVGETADLLFVGSGAVRYRDEITQRFAGRAVFLEGGRNEPSAGDVALCGLAKLRNGGGDSIDDLEPIYLREADAKLPERRG